MMIFNRSRRYLQQVRETTKAIREAVVNLATLTNDKLSEIVTMLLNEQCILNDKLGAIVAGMDNQQRVLDEKLSEFASSLEIERQMVDERLSKLVSNSVNQQRMVAMAFDRLIAKERDQRKSPTAASGTSGEDASPTMHDPLRSPERGTIPKICVCYSDNDHDRVFTENLLEFLESCGVECQTVGLGNSGQRPELIACLDAKPAAVIGYNSQLDHSWVEDSNFVELAATCGTKVIQWILDHPSTRWNEFQHSDLSNSRFLLNSRYSENYFQKYCAPGAFTASVQGVGRNWRSRISELSWERFQLRPINCLIPISLTRLSGTPDDVKQRITALDAVLAQAVTEASARARFDLNEPLERHLHAVLGAHGRSVSSEVFNECFNLVDASVQAYRRLRILDVAQNYPVLIQTDESALKYLKGGKPQWLTGVSMPVTLTRMTSCRAVLSVSPLNDMVHDRTMNALNAGCVVLIEDSLAHRAMFEDRSNALFFRYDDDSLDRSLSLVCTETLQSYQIAQEGFELRDHLQIKFGGFQDILRLAGLSGDSAFVGPAPGPSP